MKDLVSMTNPDILPSTTKKDVTNVESKEIQNMEYPEFHSDIETESDDEGVPELEEEEVPRWRQLLPDHKDVKNLKRVKKKKKKKKVKKEKETKIEIPIDRPTIKCVRPGCTQEKVLAKGTTVFDYSGTNFHAVDEIIKRQPPNFSGTDLEGKLRHLTEWTTNGRPTVVCFYVPWSGPCALQIPIFHDKALKHPVPVIPPGGVDFILCSCDHIGTFDKSGYDLIHQFHKNHGMHASNLIHMVISKDTIHKVHQYGVEYFPHLCLINKDGAVLANYDAFNWDLVIKAEIFSRVAIEKRTLNMTEFHTAWQLMGNPRLKNWDLKIKWKEIMIKKWKATAISEANKVDKDELDLKIELEENTNKSDIPLMEAAGQKIKTKFQSAVFKLLVIGRFLRSQNKVKELHIIHDSEEKVENLNEKEIDWFELESKCTLDGFDIHQMLDLPLPGSRPSPKYKIDKNTSSYYREIDRHREFWECHGCSTHNKDMLTDACVMCGLVRGSPG